MVHQVEDPAHLVRRVSRRLGLAQCRRHLQHHGSHHTEHDSEDAEANDELHEGGSGVQGRTTAKPFRYTISEFTHQWNNPSALRRPSIKVDATYSHRFPPPEAV